MTERVILSLLTALPWRVLDTLARLLSSEGPDRFPLSLSSLDILENNNLQRVSVYFHLDLPPWLLSLALPSFR